MSIRQPSGERSARCWWIGSLASAARIRERACEADFEGVRSDGHESDDDAHGRHEERYVTVIYDPTGLPPDTTSYSRQLSQHNSKYGVVSSRLGPDSAPIVRATLGVRLGGRPLDGLDRQ